jgi:hypothetical protein
MAQKMVDAINVHGGRARILDLLAVGRKRKNQQPKPEKKKRQGAKPQATGTQEQSPQQGTGLFRQE